MASEVGSGRTAGRDVHACISITAIDVYILYIINVEAVLESP